MTIKVGDKVITSFDRAKAGADAAAKTKAFTDEASKRKWFGGGAEWQQLENAFDFRVDGVEIPLLLGQSRVAGEIGERDRDPQLPQVDLLGVEL